MSTDEPFTPPRKKPNVLWWIGAGFLLLLMLFCFQLFGPNPRIVVSRQTTYITEPLKPNGLPDYEQYVLDLYREGATPENNAAVLMWQALGPGDLSPEQWPLLAAELSLDANPPRDSVLTPLYGELNRARIAEFLGSAGASLDQPFAADDEGTSADFFEYDDVAMMWNDLAYDAIGNAMSAAWRSEQLPPLAEWVKENQKPLDLLVAASQRPRFSSASVSLLDSSDVGLIGMLLENSQSVREVARVLRVRAMWHLGEGRYEAAWRDLQAIHRWARLVGQGNTLIDQLVAIAIDGIAAEGTKALLGDSGLSPELAERILADLDTLPTLTRMASVIDDGERFCFLDTIVDVSSEGGDSLMWLIDYGASNEFNPLAFVSVDWNTVLILGNDWYDRIAAAFRLPTYQARKQAFSKIDAELQQLHSESREPSAWLGAAVSQRKRSDLLAAALLDLFLPALEAASDAQDRANTTLDLTRLAAALAVHRTEQGDYPPSLDALVPRLLDELPVDLYNAKPFIYKRDGEGYLLYSTGGNGQDDGGSNQLMDVLEGRDTDDLPSDEREASQDKIPASADDISIRVPVPKFKLPELPTEVSDQD